ncbi:MAG: O-antigen ligase family protein [Candidatus Shapirobacteria bacterium]|nr:O-antigen ligase family protein [Candidatus Shapirobacteria bacterium]MDD4410447.1 O-antigen ligase family protein [Candidatus Shapirobacteria bacterium]
MAFVTSLVYLSTIVVFFFGQLLRIELKGISFPVIDIFIGLIFCLNIFQKIKNKDFKVKNKYLLYFLIFAWFSFVFNYFRYHFDLIKPILYLFRLTFLLSFFIFPPKLDEKIKKISYLGLFSNVIFGLVQYFFWPDFTSFKSLSWDPHLYRLVSTFFDPTFTALIYLFLIIIVFLDKKFPLRIPVLIISYLALALTYSRSSYLCFFVAFTFIAYQKKNLKIFILSSLLIFSTIFLLPRFEGEGTKLERTSSITAKVENYKEGFNIFLKSPIVGHGYNNLFYVRQIKNQNSHANSGFDGSLMTILTTSGIIGLILFLLGLKKVFISGNLVIKTILISLLLHSIFANSLLYPWILLFFIFL